MLTIFKAANPEYYAEYLDKDKQGVWIAYLKEVLNLPDIVTEEHYWNLIKGYSPDGRTRLFQGNGKEHLGAQDFTFSACKSVSLSMIENKEEIIQAHEEAVNAAIRFLEEHTAYTRRGKDGIKLEKVHGLLVSKHTHYESRAEQPQLHTHCLIYNLCEREDGTWGSLSYRHFYKWKMAAGAIYRCQLALNLRGLGYELRQEGDFFEIEGISEDLLKKYSKREQEISERISQLRLKNSSNKVGDKAVLHTRQSKTAATTEELFERWEKELEGLVTPKRSLENSPISGQLYVLPTEVLKELTTKKSYFREQDVYHRLAIKGQASFLSVSDISKMATMTLGSSRVIQLGVDKNNNQCFTTTEALQAEKVMIQQANDLAKSRFFIPAKFESTFEQGISNAESCLGFALEDEQIEAVKLATNAHKLTLIQGTAGTGKSTSFRAAKYIYEARGQSILGASVSKKAADSLAESAEISTFTVDMLVTQYNSGYNQLKKHAALIVDEASLLTVFQLNMLFKMALESNTKLVLAGDTFQLQAIEQPGAFNYLLKNGVAAFTKLENIRRQETDWSRKIVNQFKVGQAKPALQALYDNGFVQFNEGYDQAVSELVKLYFKLEEEQADRSRLVLAKSWRDVKAISQLIVSVRRSQVDALI
jgi:conjugative relaxase-like TrwC/TraI family protein